LGDELASALIIFRQKLVDIDVEELTLLFPGCRSSKLAQKVL
jgi:hypothetical protein